MPVYIEKSGDWDGCHLTIAGRTNQQTNKQGKIEVLSRWNMEG